MKHPLATYRIQFNRNFTFHHAGEILNYLNDLGITTIYASPVSKAREGSMHGYDVIEPERVNDELGTPDDFKNLLEQVRDNGMGWLQDIVPNHVAFTSENPWINDILENGENSANAGFPDFLPDAIPGLENRLLVPFLGKPFGQALEDGEIKLLMENGKIMFGYYDHRFPLCLPSIAYLVSLVDGEKINNLDQQEKESFSSAKMLGKNLAKGDNHRLFAEEWLKVSRNGTSQGIIRDTLEKINSGSQSYQELETLLRMQHYQLAYWKTANTALNYRRFFTINDLISVNADNQRVFDEMHSLVKRYITSNLITGLRVDHIDGLKYPADYLHELRKMAPGIYLVVEKILDEGEELPDWWPVDGNTGYDYLNMLNHIYIDSSQRKNFDNLYDNIAEFQLEGEDLKAAKKRLILKRNMLGDLNNLVSMLMPEISKLRYGADVTKHQLSGGLTEFLVYFPVYRTYISKDYFRDEDREIIKKTIRVIKEKKPDLSHVFRCFEKIFMLDTIINEEKERWITFLMRLQQLTGPLMAKGVEDTLLYSYTRLLSVNAVGSDPFSFGNEPADYHRYIANRKKHFPRSMNATSTHDTKRGEDVRARLNVLSEIPGEWEEKLHEWSGMNKNYRRLSGDKEVPDLHLEYSIYQTILGAFPFGEFNKEDFTRRIQDYFIKFQREEKVNTSWMMPDTEMEQNVSDFIHDILSDENGFLSSFHEFFERVSFHGILNTLSQLTLKICSPGVPDFYQGTGLWDLSLVDPDNRRPVDYHVRSTYLEEMIVSEKNDSARLLEELMKRPASGKIKLWLTRILLQARKKKGDLFTDGSYQPVETRGKHANRVVSFYRRSGNDTLLVVAPRLTTELTDKGKYPLGTGCWGNTTLTNLAETGMRDLISGKEIQVSNEMKAGEILEMFPVAVLINTN